MIAARKATGRDATFILGVHLNSVRALCRDHYSPEQIDEWVGTKTAESYSAGMNRGEAFVVAEDESRIVGFAVLDPSEGEIKAVYVDPNYSRRGVGTLMLSKLEQIAAESGLHKLHLKSTLNAVGFYRHAGYEDDGLTCLSLRSGAELPCLGMTKVLVDANQSTIRSRAQLALKRLGGRPAVLAERSLPLFDDAKELAVAQVSASGREHRLIPRAAKRWIELRSSASKDGVALVVISAFRSFDRQFELIEAKVGNGETIDEILAVMAPPGCSEHHTGRAVDVGTPGCSPLSTTFAKTDAFRWLEANAADYGFRLSFPPDNPWGYQYEPWHWCFHEELPILDSGTG